MFSFFLAFPYIQCTDAIWSTMFYDADTHKQDQNLSLCQSS